MKKNNFHEQLKEKMDEYVHFVYKITKQFPKEEMYGITSQLRRSSMSIILNYIEGYARNMNNKNKVYKNFLEISYGSMKESAYLLEFSLKEKYISKTDFEKSNKLLDEIGAMLWGTLQKL